MTSVIPRKTLIVGFHFSNLDTVSYFSKKKKKNLHVFCLEFGIFFWSKHKEQFLMNSRENIKVKKLSKYYRGGKEGKKFQWNCKRKQSELSRKLYSRHLNRFNNRVTFFYFYFFTFFEKIA